MYAVGQELVMVCAGVVLSVMKYLTFFFLVYTVQLADCTQNIHIFNIFGRVIINSLKLL